MKANRNNNSKPIVPNVVRGGIAIPLGNNYYYMKGRKHKDGGIDIGNNPRTGLEVEGEEVVHTTPKELKVYSSVPFLNGISPAEKLLSGENPNKVFNEQQRFKKVNHIKDDGTKATNQIANQTVNATINYEQNKYNKKHNEKRLGGDEKLTANIAPQTSNFVSYYHQNVNNTIDKLNNTNVQKYNDNAKLNSFYSIKRKNEELSNKNANEANKYIVDVVRSKKLDEEANKYLIDYDDTNEIKFTSGRYNTGKVSTKVLDNIYDTAIEAKMNPLELLAVAGRESTFGIARGYKKGTPISATNLMSNWQQVQPYIVDSKLSSNYIAIINKIKEKGESSLTKEDIDIINKYRDEDKKAADSTKAITENPIVNAAKYYMSGKYNPGDKDYHNKILKEMETLKADKAFMNWYNSRSKKAMGGLSRDKDYDSKKKPYPSVSKSDFAGDNRSYPIPTKADAIDALRLAGLHGRSDVRAKVLSRYPELRKKAKRGGIYSVNIGGVEHLKSTSFTGEDSRRKQYALGTVLKKVLEDNNATAKVPDLEVPEIEDSNISIKDNKFIPLKDNLNIKPMSIETSKPYTTEDYIGAGANILGNIGSYFTNKRMLNRLQSPSQPVVEQAAKLKTRININPQLDRMRESISAAERDIDSNTASSRTALARKQRLRNAGLQTASELYGNKENAETQLINQDRLNQQQVASRNVAAYNAYRTNKTNFENTVREKQSENAVNLISGSVGALQDMLSRKERREADRQNRLAIAAAHPNVNPRILKDMGIKGITDKDIASWDKAFGRKKSGK